MFVCIILSVKSVLRSGQVINVPSTKCLMRQRGCNECVNKDMLFTINLQTKKLKKKQLHRTIHLMVLICGKL